MGREWADDPASADLLAAAFARAAGVEELSGAIVQAWSVSPHTELVVDLSDTSELDAVVVDALRIATREIEGAGGRVRVLGPREG